MKTLKEFLDKVATMWPKMKEEEKDMMTNAILAGNVFEINKVLKTIQKEIKKRENKTN
jgi:hypothetical protein